MPMPVHKFRCDDSTWLKAAGKAAREGTTPSALIRQWLDNYANDTTLFEQPLSEATVARFLGVSRQRVHQIRERAVNDGR